MEAKGIKIEGKLSKGNKLEELLKADTKLGKEDKVGKEARDSANGVLAKELLKGELLMAPLLDKVSALDKDLSLIHISEPTRLRRISYAVFCLKKKKILN